MTLHVFLCGTYVLHRDEAALSPFQQLLGRNRLQRVTALQIVRHQGIDLAEAGLCNVSQRGHQQQHAWATIATATRLRPWIMSRPVAPEGIGPGTEGQQQRGRRQRECRPRQQGVGQAAAQVPQREADLAACRSRQELAQGDQVRIGRLAQPAAAQHQLVAKVAEVGERVAERGQPELEKGAEDFA